MRTLLLTSVLAGCGAGGAFTATDAATPFDSGETSATQVDTGPTTAAPPRPSWWSLDAVIGVVGGAPDAASSTVEVSLWDATPDLVCRHDVPVAAAVDQPPPELEQGALAWWHLTLGDGVSTTTGCPDWSARELWVGLGPYDHALDPAMFAHGWADIPGYSLLVQETEGGSVWLVGLAGNADQWDGGAVPVTAPPVADGAYEAHGVYLLPYP